MCECARREQIERCDVDACHPLPVLPYWHGRRSLGGSKELIDLRTDLVQIELAMRAFKLLACLLLCLPAMRAQMAEGWDFLPGEKQLLYDDFTDMKPGGQPPHWKVRRSVARLSSAGRMVASDDLILTPNIVKWPRNFTIEQEFIIEKPTSEPVITWHFGIQEEGTDWRAGVAFVADGTCAAEAAADGQEVASAPCRYDAAKPVKLHLWLQEGRLRLYLGNKRLFDVNQVNTGNWKHGWLDFRTSEGPVHFSYFRIAESTPDLSKTMFSTGRFVTHGIHFDTSSDRVKPESAPVMKLVASALHADPAMKLQIEGHTDSTGDAAKNMDLSARRAASVKDALAHEFGIDAVRLQTAGFGATKPVADNATPAGRAENRRVEFVKK